jgi:hypothetical protein
MDNSKDGERVMKNDGTDEVDDGAAAVSIDHDLEDSSPIIREVAAAAAAADEAVEDGDSKPKRKIMKVSVDAPWSARMWEGVYIYLRNIAAGCC